MPKIVVLGTKGFFHHAEPLIKHYGNQVVVEADYTPEKVSAHNPDLVIAFEASNAQRGLCIAEMMRRNVAALLIMDGIQEWRNTWSRTQKVIKRPLNQPALVHKIACLGRLDARLYESWGNVGMCEVVGAPRLDNLISQQRPGRIEPILDRPLRLLVMTARTPGFTAEETAVTLESLRDLQSILEQRTDIEVVWRISKGLHLELGVKNTYNSATGAELHDLLPQMDAVITTPSTAQLEAMLFGLPTALLNYHFVPLYTQAAWEIKCKEHIPLVLNDLTAPPLERIVYQDFCLQDALHCKTEAMPRLVYLIDEMLRIKQEFDVNSQGQLTFPDRILDSSEPFVSWPSQNFNLERLYPGHPVFGNRDMTVLQSELDAALITIQELKDQTDTLTKRLHGIPGYLIAKKIILKIQKNFYLGGHSKV